MKYNITIGNGTAKYTLRNQSYGRMIEIIKYAKKKNLKTDVKEAKEKEQCSCRFHLGCFDHNCKK